MNNMSDLSFTQASRAMKSTHLDRQKGGYIPWGVIVVEHKRKPKVLIDRARHGKRSNPHVFMGC